MKAPESMAAYKASLLLKVRGADAEMMLTHASSRAQYRVTRDENCIEMRNMSKDIKGDFDCGLSSRVGPTF